MQDSSESYKPQFGLQIRAAVTVLAFKWINKDVFYPSSGEKASPAPSILLAERKLSHYIIYAQRMDSRLGVDRFVSCRIWPSVFALRDVTLYQICSFFNIAIPLPFCDRAAAAVMGRAHIT